MVLFLQVTDNVVNRPGVTLTFFFTGIERLQHKTQILNKSSYFLLKQPTVATLRGEIVNSSGYSQQQVELVFLRLFLSQAILVWADFFDNAVMPITMGFHDFSSLYFFTW